VKSNGLDGTLRKQGPYRAFPFLMCSDRERQETDRDLSVNLDPAQSPHS
jgi:hypothetical protein